ncbi:MAG: 2-succinyl-5-enolpyruvyl-6-hydroxy-3-cyclohexene-1-carboxylate synthase [Winogradskyella sp.]|nr:2-succinyl-5-enolpyruvyl-6-hydroxy-3-cyclohexene-1-carboxylate synthase [Winogradskyella sp.]
MKYSKIPLAQTVVQACKINEIRHVVISPGSRSAPLTIGFTADDFFKCYSIVDERCAAFFALGIAQQLKRPVALVCTSGSALLNYYPAISEAYYSNIPLVVLSADRPKHLIDIGDGQTIKQKDVYGKHVVYSVNLKLDIKDENNIPLADELPILKNLENKLERFLGIQKDIQEFNTTEIESALHMAVFKSAPVHLNVPFDEPLYDTVNEPQVHLVPKELELPKSVLDDYDISYCVDQWHAAKKKMILVGVQSPNNIEQKWLDDLAEDDSVVVLTETTSNLHHPEFFSSIDQLITPLNEAEFKELQPDILLTFGGMIVSKRIKAFLRKYKPKHHWHVDEYRSNDTFFSLSKHIKAQPNEFLKMFLTEATHYSKSDYKPKWKTVNNYRLKKHQEYLSNIPYSDFMVFNMLLMHLPGDSQLQVGNSSAIRYTQLFQIPNNVSVFCNRGTSGIDGSTSTAIGAAVVHSNRTTFITGDLSFFYDSNALWNNYVRNDFRIIVINNQGGGIFRILPGHKDTENFDTYFETKHQLSAIHLCKMYGFDYCSADSKSSLSDALTTFYAKSKAPKLLEIYTPDRLNDKILLDYFKFIK